MSLQPGFYSLLVQIQMGYITHAGNDRARTALMESLWLVIGKDPHVNWRKSKLFLSIVFVCCNKMGYNPAVTYGM
jgi:hypothetical protein